MTTIRFVNVLGATRGEAVRLDGRRRRLATVMRSAELAAHASGRPFIVSVHRLAEDDPACAPTDATVRMRKDWSRTLVGRRDVVLVTYLPRGGGGRGGGGGKGIGSIALGLASIALIALAPYAAPALFPSLVFGTTPAFVLQAGMVIGGLALGAAAQSSSASKAKQRSLYSVAGGGNVPKAGSRKPLLYGRCWSAPPLSQQDYFGYDGDVNVLVKRMTLGLGKFQIHTVRVGDSLFWQEGAGIVAPYNAVAGGPLGTAIEFIYGTPSTIAPGDVISSSEVAGQEMPRPGGNPDWTPWFRLTPPGVVADAAQMNWTYPQIYRTSSAGRQTTASAGVVFQGQRIDPDTGDLIGAPFQLWRSEETNVLTTTALRRTAYFPLPEKGAYRVRAQNLYPAPVGFVQENRASWDSMSGFKNDVRIRPNTTEIAMRVRAGAGIMVTTFSDIMVEASRIIPVWSGSEWVETTTSKSVWAYADLVRAEYGLDQPNGFDADKALHYAEELSALDTFDGALPEVSSFWEASGTVLHPMRADPVKVGAVHSFVRDESRNEPRHIITRRQIVLDSSTATFNLTADSGDVIVEFDRDGDPKRPDEARYSYGPRSRTPKRYRVDGIRDGAHAMKHATWLAAVGVFRGSERKMTTEWDGRLVYPGDHVLSDLWFLKGPQVFGVASSRGLILRLDVRATLSSEWGYGSIRTRVGREWGILRMRGAGPDLVELDAADVATLTQNTGRTLADVLARETQDPTTLVIGELVELQETYVVRSAIPSDPDHVQLEMVNDDPRVWQLLDEAVLGPLPVNGSGLEEPLVPEIAIVHARCVQIETGIEVTWGTSITRGARSYEADLSYDGGATWEVLSPLGPASSGRAPMRQSDLPVTVRVRAYGRTGLHGAYATATFTTIAPVIDGNQVGIVNLPKIDYAGLTADVQARIAHILEVEATAKATATDLLARVLAAAAVGDANTAAIYSESQSRLTGDTALATDISAAVVRIGATEAGVITERTARIDGDTAQARRTDALIVQTNSDRAYFLDQVTVRTNAEGALSDRITSLSASVGANTSAIVSEQNTRASADGAQSGRTDALIAQTDSDRSYFLSTTQSLANTDGALVSYANDLYARTDAGTAVGRFSMQAVSGPAGVSARIQALLAAQRGGQTYGAGYYLDLLDNGTSRFVIDADKFYITQNGASVPTFQFDGQTLRVPYLQLTGANAPPGVANQPARYDVSNYVLIAGAGTLNNRVDPNMVASVPVENGIFPTIIAVRGHLTLGTNTTVSGLQLLIDGAFVTNIYFGGTGAFLTTQGGTAESDFAGVAVLFLSPGNHYAQFRFGYLGQDGNSKVTINSLSMAANTPRA
ncbi:host specificity factor TipJ family phage tail protein [Methylobacterium sp. J-092]|uniref:host specificity factor TipJ family phage tail protein n=1 Tax=Methylobacterium sp. J-092 TaxID=2836667 RepID=UPI001FBBD169|nr:host specificity factor TipJ family phage tail protein [Methylobacterium sp. J-092]MCJ2009184.1 host specificity factor TipJ family phage tail protein [Methylobacterium sp. J-092]